MLNQSVPQGKIMADVLICTLIIHCIGQLL